MIHKPVAKFMIDSRLEVVVNEALFLEFVRHLSAGLNVVDVLLKNQELNRGDDLNRDDPIMLAVTKPEIIGQLVDLSYPELILQCIHKISFLEECSDVFRSELDDDLYNFFVKALQVLTQQVSIVTTEDGFMVHCSALISDLILSPVGRVHNELLQSLHYFNQMLEAVGGDATRLFLNAKSPTPESQYIQIWVAGKLGIPTAPPSEGIIAVV